LQTHLPVINEKLQTERDLLHAKLHAKTSLYLVDYVDQEACLIGLTNAFHIDDKVVITDMGLSQTLIAKKYILATRVMRFDGFACTAGVSHVFKVSKMSKLKAKLPKIMKKIPLKSRPAQATLAFNYLSDQFGEKIKFEGSGEW